MRLTKILGFKFGLKIQGFINRVENIGVKNYCNQPSDVKEVQKLGKTNNAAINQRNDTFNRDFVSCDCPKSDDSYDFPQMRNLIIMKMLGNPRFSKKKRGKICK